MDRLQNILPVYTTATQHKHLVDGVRRASEIEKLLNLFASKA